MVVRSAQSLLRALQEAVAGPQMVSLVNKMCACPAFLAVNRAIHYHFGWAGTVVLDDVFMVLLYSFTRILDLFHGALAAKKPSVLLFMRT